MRGLLVDSSYLIALFDESDPFHSPARQIFADYFQQKINSLLLLWPILFETFSTKMSNWPRVRQISIEWKKLDSSGQIQFVDDTPFRDNSLSDWFLESERPRRAYRKFSLVDRVIRSALASDSLRIDALLTFDNKLANDRELSKVCTRRSIEIVK